MAKTDFKSVDEYIATHPEDVQAILRRVRSAIRKAVPGAEEVISYQIPTYKLHGSYVVSRVSLCLRSRGPEQEDEVDRALLASSTAREPRSSCPVLGGQRTEADLLREHTN